MKVSFLLSVLGFFFKAAVAEQCGNTTLTCAKPEIPCAQGKADFSMHPKNAFGETFLFLKDDSEKGYYCDCPAGRTGLRCARKYEVCEGTGHYCYHGGKCIPGLENITDTSQLFCDCTDASHNSFPYRGKFCEVELQVCGPNTQKFCANDGQCKVDFENKIRPCECPGGYRGPHCEFNDGHVPNCNLGCENDGVCTRGIKTYGNAVYNNFFANHDGTFQYCDCKEGFYGLKCEAQATVCGDAQCFHGGECIKTSNQRNETIFACDCKNAQKGDVKYAGQFCQSPATSICPQSEDNGNGDLFCTNNGQCKVNAHEGCECQGDFHGPQCEHSGTINKDDTPKCDLQCRNGGECRTGQKDTSMFSQFGEEMRAYNQTNINFQHCVCPDGYFGIQCEHQLDVCPGREHVCLHGSKCIAINESDPDEKKHECDCDYGFDGLQKFGGKFCQYESTDICTNDRKPGVSKASDAYCVNNGRCLRRVDDNKEGHPGCDCPVKFSGPHCEYIKGSEPAGYTTVVKSSKEEGAMDILLALAAILVALIFVIVVMILSGKKKKNMMSRGDGSIFSDVEETNADPVAEDLDPKGDGMQNVEII